MPSIETCLSPSMLHLHELKEKTIVVADIFRATSCMVTGMGAGLGEIIPVSSPEACYDYREKGYLCAGEQDGIKVDGFDLGNSPFEFEEAAKSSAKVVMSTTNGTKAINAAAGSAQILIGAFLNLSAINQKIKQSARDVLVLCAGWKNRFSLEDTLFAGALANYASAEFATEDDATLAAIDLFEKANNDLTGYLLKSAHAQRLGKIGITKDLAFCSQLNHYNIVPIVKNNIIVLDS